MTTNSKTNSTTYSTIASACPLINISSAEELAQIHESSVVKHAHIIAGEESAKEKIVNYFNGLKAFLEKNNFQGCPYSNALVATKGADSNIVSEVKDHKQFVREFFISLAYDLVEIEEAKFLGEHLFLLYAGATNEAQNFQSLWPVDRSLQVVDRLLEEY